jgi:hypothetical protein
MGQGKKPKTPATELRSCGGQSCVAVPNDIVQTSQRRRPCFLSVSVSIQEIAKSCRASEQDSMLLCESIFYCDTFTEKERPRETPSCATIMLITHTLNFAKK